MASFNVSKDTLVTCPYDPAHKMLQSRLQMHITKCKLSNKNKKLFSCSFNAAHVVPKKDLSHHEENCPDRLPLDKQLARNLHENEFTQRQVPERVYESPKVESIENWTAEIASTPSQGYIPKDQIMGDGIIQDLGMMKPAERKKIYKLRPNETAIEPAEVAAPPAKPKPASRQPKQTHKDIVMDGEMDHAASAATFTGLKKFARDGSRYPYSSSADILLHSGIGRGHKVQHNDDEEYPPLEKLSLGH